MRHVDEVRQAVERLTLKAYARARRSAFAPAAPVSRAAGKNGIKALEATDFAERFDKLERMTNR
jgi:hypothetical protein